MDFPYFLFLSKDKFLTYYSGSLVMNLITNDSATGVSKWPIADDHNIYKNYI
jgi:hypothetical protein